MNKLTIFIITLITIGLIASPAFAADRLAASDFFYGEAIANPIQSVNTDAVKQADDIQNQPISLSASSFFYGDTIPNHIEAVNTNHQHGRANVAALPGQLNPEAFYGYTNANTVVTNCRCTTCTNC